MELCRKVIVLMIIASDAAQLFSASTTTLPPLVKAFSAVVVSVSPKSSHHAAAAVMSRLYGMTPRRNKEGEDADDSFNVNEARRQLESLISNNNSNDKDALASIQKQQATDAPWTVASLLAAVSSGRGDNDDDDDDDDDDQIVTLPPPPPVLTAADRDRRLTEIQLLQKLDFSNDNDNDDSNDKDDNMAVNLLWDLWYGERGMQAMRRLEESNQLMADPSGWRKCERLLHDMIADYGIYYYTEPLNRLATLYFLQGRLEESYKLCRIILQIKPWHFGALSGIVLVLQQMGKRSEAQKWAELCLPPRVVASTSFPPFADETNGPPNPLRKEWVRRAVKAAQQALSLAEQRAKESFGDPEEYYSGADKSSLEKTEEESDWQ